MNLIFILPVYNSENIIKSSLSKLIDYLNNFCNINSEFFFIFLSLMMVA
jgi:uncharacterized protein YutD